MFWDTSDSGYVIGDCPECVWTRAALMCSLQCAHMSHQDNSVFVDASGRRGRLVRWSAAGVGVACLGFLGIVIAGSFGAGPAGGPLPWADEERRDAPALIQPTPATSGDGDGESEGTPKRTGTPRGTADASGTSATPTSTPASASTPTVEATTSAPAPSTSTSATPTVPSPTATPGGGGAGGGGGETTDTGPGKADEAPGATKRPR